MKDIIADLASWPVRTNGQPFIRSTHEALLYAQLIWEDEKKQSDLLFHRQDAYKQLTWERRKECPSPQRMMDLAFRAQMFRECLEECERIKDE